MSRPARSRILASALPAGAIAVIVLALLWTTNAIPRVPVVSEVVGLVAVLIAPGTAVEPVFHSERWTAVERLGLAAALSLALAGLLGVGLHLAGLAVSPTNVLVLLLLVSAILGTLSVRFRSHRTGRLAARAQRPEVLVSLGSLVLLAAGFASILLLHPAPRGPSLEIMAVDGTGRLMIMPVHSGPGGTSVTVAVRSVPGDVRSVSMTVEGDGIRPWSVSDVTIGTEWTTIQIPLAATAAGSSPHARRRRAMAPRSCFQSRWTWGNDGSRWRPSAGCAGTRGGDHPVAEPSRGTATSSRVSGAAVARTR